MSANVQYVRSVHPKAHSEQIGNNVFVFRDQINEIVLGAGRDEREAWSNTAQKFKTISKNPAEERDQDPLDIFVAFATL